MDAGRELDALVAEKVMGWAHEQHLTLGSYHGKIENVFFLDPEQAAYRRRSEHDTYWDRWSPTGADIIISEAVPPYSTSIAAAWEVVEKLRKRLCCLRLDSDHNFLWECYGIEDADDADHNEPAIVKWKIYAQADTAPLAICLAALKFKELVYVPSTDSQHRRIGCDHIWDAHCSGPLDQAIPICRKCGQQGGEEPCIG